MSTAEQIHLCFECGAKNRIPRGMEASAKCGRCGKPIYPNLKPSPKPTNAAKPSPSPAARTAPATPNDGRRVGGWFPALLGLLLIGVLSYGYLEREGLLAGRQGRSSGAASTDPAGASWRDAPIATPGAAIPASSSTPGTSEHMAPAPTPRPTTLARVASPVKIETGMVWNKTGRAGVAPFEIVTQRGMNYFVKLVDANTGLDRLAIFVTGGKREEVSVPTGRYKMKYAAGVTWYGEDIFFGPGDKTVFSESSSIFHFRETAAGYEGYTVELILQAGGNMSTHNIPRNQF